MNKGKVTIAFENCAVTFVSRKWWYGPTLSQGAFSRGPSGCHGSDLSWPDLYGRLACILYELSIEYPWLLGCQILDLFFWLILKKLSWSWTNLRALRPFRISDNKVLVAAASSFCFRISEVIVMNLRSCQLKQEGNNLQNGWSQPDFKPHRWSTANASPMNHLQETKVTAQFSKAIVTFPLFI